MSARDLAAVLADLRGDAAVLRRSGDERIAKVLEATADAVASAAEDFLLWLSETDAMVRTGRSRDWLRGRFPGWEADGHARLAGRDRQYRAVILPRRASLVQAHEAGRNAARAARDAAA